MAKKKSKGAKLKVKTSGRKKKSLSRQAAKKRVTRKKPVRKKSDLAHPPPRSAGKARFKLGRPKISGDEKLFLLFKDNYHARQIFEFLHVETLKELEQHSPEDIVKRLKHPIEETVRRIREKLAEYNRCLRGDEAYASNYQQAHGGIKAYER